MSEQACLKSVGRLVMRYFVTVEIVLALLHSHTNTEMMSTREYIDGDKSMEH